MVEALGVWGYGMTPFVPVSVSAMRCDAIREATFGGDVSQTAHLGKILICFALFICWSSRSCVSSRYPS